MCPSPHALPVSKLHNLLNRVKKDDCPEHTQPAVTVILPHPHLFVLVLIQLENFNRVITYRGTVDNFKPKYASPPRKKILLDEATISTRKLPRYLNCEGRTDCALTLLQISRDPTPCMAEVALAMVNTGRGCTTGCRVTPIKNYHVARAAILDGGHKAARGLFHKIE